MPALLLAFALCGAAEPAPEAEWIRIALARGPSLRIEGRRLVGQVAGAAPVELGAVAELSAAGPFVTDGGVLAPRMAVTDAAGAPVRVAGRSVLGSLEILARDEGLLAVDVVDLEDYVGSVVGAEMPPSWPAAALQAQAIAARTYALRRKAAAPDAPFHLEASVLHQAYKGAESVDPRSVAAARATRGLVLAAGQELAEAYFFASCRGTTESALAAFGRDVASLQPVSCEGGDEPRTAWTRTLPLAALSARLREAGALGDTLTGLEIVRRTSTGRVALARLVTRRGGRVVTGAELRRLVGYSELPSLDFEASTSDGSLVLTGAGSGHGVGLCQWCARAMAARGASRDDILTHFYAGTGVRRVY